MVIADKTDLIGMEESAKRTNIFSTKVSLKAKGNVYSLGDRIYTLTNADPGIILTHASEENNLVHNNFQPIKLYNFFRNILTKLFLKVYIDF
jgi:hypothetical protein